MEGLDINRMSFEEAIVAIKRALQVRYPNSGMVYFAYSIDDKNRISTFGHFGDKRECELAGTDIAASGDKIAGDFIDDVFLNRVMSIKSGACIKYRSLKMLHDYAVDYAKDLGIDTTGIGYFCNRDQAPEERKDVINDTESIAARIKLLDDERKSLMRNLDPQVKAATLKALAKRMRRAGDIAGANAKDKEAEEVLLSIKRKAESRIKAIANLKKAREAKFALKKKKEQAEKDRQKGMQQFDPHKAAKAKRQKIRERQAERNASKKKASENKGWVNRPIDQVIASRI